MFVPCFVVHYSVSFLVCNHLTGKEKAGCFTLIAFLCHLSVSVLCHFITVPLVGLQHVIVALTGHIHLLFHVILLSSI